MVSALSWKDTHKNSNKVTSNGYHGDMSISSLSQGKEARLDGNTVAMALFILQKCPVHSRYLRQGVGEHKIPLADEVLVTPSQVCALSVTVKPPIFFNRAMCYLFL